MLTDIAEATGGRYFRARDTQELRGIYEALDALEPVAREGQRFRPRRAVFTWPLGLALLLGALVLVHRYGRV